MSTIKDFENAPAGATATHKASGNRVMKVDGVELRWVTRWGRRLTDKEVVRWGFTLDPATPTTAREALDLAWDLAHEVKEGQTIPSGARYLAFSSDGVREHVAYGDREINSVIAPTTRTLEPLPEPEPDWVDAPAVIATTRWCDTELWLPETGGYYWECTHCDDVRYWRDLTDVTPLYPKEVQEA